jgi:hypothetical protein
MALKHIAAAVAAFQKLTDDEKKVFKQEVRKKRGRRKVLRRKRASTAKPVAKRKTATGPIARKKKTKGKKGKKKGEVDVPIADGDSFARGLDGPRADPLRDVVPE